LVGATGVLISTSDAIEMLDDIFRLHSHHQRPYALQVAIASAHKHYVTHHIVGIQFHLY
jgi:hypothetical protein